MTLINSSRHRLFAFIFWHFLHGWYRFWMNDARKTCAHNDNGGRAVRWLVDFGRREYNCFVVFIFSILCNISHPILSFAYSWQQQMVRRIGGERNSWVQVRVLTGQFWYGKWFIVVSFFPPSSQISHILSFYSLRILMPTPRPGKANGNINRWRWDVGNEMPRWRRWRWCRCESGEF